MRIRRTLISAAFAASLAALPLSAAKAQNSAPPCWFPLFLPFCVAGAAVNAAGTIVTAPFRALTPRPYYEGYAGYYGYYGEPNYPEYYRPYAPAPRWRYRRWCYYHPRRCPW